MTLKLTHTHTRARTPTHTVRGHTQFLTGHGQGALEFFEWRPEEGTRFTVVRLSDGEIIGRYLGEAFFSYHHINAVERETADGKKELAIDMTCYPDAGYAMLTIEELKKLLYPNHVFKNGQVRHDGVSHPACAQLEAARALFN